MFGRVSLDLVGLTTTAQPTKLTQRALQAEVYLGRQNYWREFTRERDLALRNLFLTITFRLAYE